MSEKRIILEMGTGNDLYGEDYTKAARRAVHDALHHSSLTLFRSLGLDRDAMQITVTVGVQRPEQVDTEAVAAEIPFGTVQVNVEFGGLNIEDPEAGTLSVMALAGVEAFLELPDERFTLPAGW